MARIAWIGTGMMGSGFVAALLRRGDRVVVYNRSREKAERLRGAGAQVASTAREAVRGAERVHSILADDATVDALLDDLEGHIPKEAPLIDHTTVAPRPTAARFGRCARAGIPFLHAPVFMSPQMASESKGVMLCSGPKTVFDRVRDALEPMSTDLWYLGERPDKASALKLCGNQMLLFIVAGLTDVYAMARSVGLSAAETHELFSHFKPGGAIEARGKSMAERKFSPPSFELAMARKDARLMLETAEAGGAALSVLPCIARLFDAAIARGDGDKDYSAVAREAVA